MPQGAPADVVQPALDGILQLLVTQQDRRCQGQPEVLGGIVGVLTPWRGGGEETAVSRHLQGRPRGSAGNSELQLFST